MIVESLHAELERRGFNVDTVLIPHTGAWQHQLEQYMALRLIDLTEASGNTIDRVITMRYPAHALQHPNKVTWFMHHHRGAYDLWGTSYQDLPNDEEGVQLRQSLMAADNRYLRECQQLYTISRTVAKRISMFNELETDAVLYPPLPDAERYHEGEFEDYFLYSSRLTSIKRQELAIEAMGSVRGDFKLVLTGRADNDQYLKQLQRAVERCGVKNKVRFTGWVSDAEKIELTANASGVLYLAYQEDYGYSTLEGFYAGKPVITFADSGGPGELVEHQTNGLVVHPTPEALAEAMDSLWADRQRARSMGKNGLDTPMQHQIHWDRVVEKLTS